MYTRFASIFPILLVLVGCTGGTIGATQSSSVAPEIGVTIDEEMRVVHIFPESAAEKAEVQIGDILVDLTWIPTDEGEAVATPANTAGTEPNVTPITDTNTTSITDGDTVTQVVPIPAATSSVEEFIEKEPVPFTDDEGIVYLTIYGVPLRLRVIRAGEELDITVTPTVRVRQLVSPDAPTPSPGPVGHKTF